jgi:hypothetical protein
MTILIGVEGGIRMGAGSDWPLDSMGAHYGAQMAYRVSQRQSRVRVEGRSEGSTCLFETPQPDVAARLLLGSGAGMYRVIAAAPQRMIAAR